MKKQPIEWIKIEVKWVDQEVPDISTFYSNKIDRIFKAISKFMYGG